MISRQLKSMADHYFACNSIPKSVSGKLPRINTPKIRVNFLSNYRIFTEAKIADLRLKFEKFTWGY